MICLELVTEIAAPRERCFDLARSIELHIASAGRTGERVIAGTGSGLIGPGEEVTWRGRHFGMDLTHTSRITKYERPGHFQDCMIRGHFQSFTHDHLFEEHGNKTFMTDIVQFQAPLGIISQPIDRFLLKPHIEKFLLRRNEHIRRIAEGEDWKRFLR